MRRRSFLASLAGFLAMPAWAGGLEDGDAAWAKGDWEAARAAWSAALGAETDPAKRVDLMLRTASALRQLGRLDDASKVLDEAEATGLLAPRVANDRGLLWLAYGDAPQAEVTLKGAFEAARAAGDAPLAASVANNLGLARMALGRPDEAGKAFEAARAVFATLGDDHGRADALTNAGLAHRRAGRLREARAALEQAVALYEKAGDLVGGLDARNDLGVVLQALGLDAEAAALYRAAGSSAPDPRRRAALSANLATVAHRAGDEARARELYAVAEAELVRAGRPDDAVAVALQRVLLGHPDPAELRKLYERAKDPRVRASAALNLGGLVLEKDPAEAARLAQEARKLGGEAWRADYLEGRVALAAGRRDKARTLLRRAVDNLEATRRSLSEADAERFRGQYRPVYEALVQVGLGDGDTRGVAVAAERMALAEHDAPPVPDDPVAVDLRALADRRRWLEGELAAAPAGRKPALQAQLAAVEAEFSLTIDQLRAAHPHFAELVRTDPEDLEAVRAELPVGVVVVQPVVLPEKLVLLVYRRERLLVHEVAVGSPDLSKQVLVVAKSLRAADTWDPEWTRGECDKLGAWLWAPIAEELATATTVVVSATGVLRQLPFALLRHGGAWLAEKVAVANVTHVGSLRSAAGKFKVSGRSMLFVGNPDGTLPGAEAEVRALAKAYGGAKVLVGAEGAREAVIGACEGRELVHLATHGVLDPAVPDKSHIVLAGYPSPEGRLGYREIPGLGRWLGAARLVVLSACESGLPSDAVSTSGAMAINGLAGQFRRAGVETLVASLWKVSDEGTLALMTAFYARLQKGEDLARALQGAQKELLADARLAHPYFWAPFVVVGDWR